MQSELCSISHYNSTMNKHYSVNDSQWSKIEPLIHADTGRPAEHDYRSVVNGALYREATGISWRDLPSIYPQWQTVHHHRQNWDASGVWSKIKKIVEG